MERGEEGSIAIAVLSVISIVGVLATITLFLRQPAGLIAQGQNIYPTEDITGLPIVCSEYQAIFLGYDANFKVYCCKEDMNGQNECRSPQRILIR